MWPRQNYCSYLDTRGFFLLLFNKKGGVLFRTHPQRPNTLGNVRRREFWHYMHQLRVMILVICWVARLLSSATLCSVLSANVAPGELLRLRPGSAGRAPQ